MEDHKACIIPSLRYKNARAAIDWLTQAFGFEKHLVIEGENNSIVHAQLRYENSMVMLSSEKENEYGKLISAPESLGGKNTQAPYIVVEKIDEHYIRAVNQGAKVIIEIKDEDYGGRGYTCEDPEGYLWNFGSYNPWAEIG